MPYAEFSAPDTTTTMRRFNINVENINLMAYIQSARMGQQTAQDNTTTTYNLLLKFHQPAKIFCPPKHLY